MKRTPQGHATGHQRAPGSGRFTRRDFLTTSAAALGSSALAGCDASLLEPNDAVTHRTNGAATGLVHLFADESGQLDRREPFVLGLLRTRDPTGRETDIEALRQAHGFLPELRYSSTDRRKLGFARALVQLFAANDDLAFSAAVLPGGSPRVTSFDLYRHVIRDVLRHAGSFRLGLEYRTINLVPDLTLRDDLLQAFDAVGPEIEFIDSKRSGLSQLSDLLTGSVRGDVVGRGRRRTGAHARAAHDVKGAIIAALRAVLGVRNLTDPSLTTRRDFNVRVLHPPFRHRPSGRR